MNNKIYLLMAFVLVSNLLHAETEHRDRVHSVRKVVDSIGKQEEKNVSIVDSFKHMFSDGKISGQLRTMNVVYKQKKVGVEDTYATALGGILKYELAEFNGFNAGVAVYTSHDISFATGKGNKHNNELSSSSGEYTEMAEAYINYKYNDFNLRLGRQLIDTPLADSDDIRMINNTFNAYILTYNYADIEFMLGHLKSWQGVDANLDNPWNKTGKNGTNLVGASYTDELEFNVWYYNITNNLNAVYLDVGYFYEYSKEYQFHAVGQYLHESELNSSGFGADIYGGLFEIVAYDIGFNIAFNKSNKEVSKQTFSGNGGGTMFTSMDTSIIDDIANDRDVLAIVTGIIYSVDNFQFLYAYGDFNGGKNSAGQQEHKVEQDISVEYNINDEFLVSIVYANVEDKQYTVKTENDWNRVQAMVNYNF